jgi:phage gp36-like protein
MLKHELTAKYSYDALKESVDLSRYQSIKELQVFDAVNDVDDLKDVVNSYICSGMVRPAKLTY